MLLTWESVSTICGLLISIGGVIALVCKAIKPIKEASDRFAEYEDRLGKAEESIEKGNESNKLQIKCLLRLVTHEINGNGIDGLKEVQDEMQEYLIKHHE